MQSARGVTGRTAPNVTSVCSNRTKRKHRKDQTMVAVNRQECFTLEATAKYLGKSRQGLYNIRKKYDDFPRAHGFRGGPQYIEKRILRAWCKKNNIPIVEDK